MLCQNLNLTNCFKLINLKPLLYYYYELKFNFNFMYMKKKK